MKDIFVELTTKIIQEQENIIGPLAVEQANRVPGLQVNWIDQRITFDGNRTQILNQLIEQYRNFFGQASVEVCREAVKKYLIELTPDQVPTILR